MYMCLYADTDVLLFCVLIWMFIFLFQSLTIFVPFVSRFNFEEAA